VWPSPLALPLMIFIMADNKKKGCEVFEKEFGEKY
jgi:hypothetical protein